MTPSCILIEPSGATDFVRAEYGKDKVWFKSQTALWLPLLLPSAIAGACSGANLVFSTWRTFALKDPAFFSLPDGAGFSVRILLPLGGLHGDLWGGLLYHTPGLPPVSWGDKFVPGNGGLRHKLDGFFTPERIDSYRKPGRAREDLWVRRDLTAEELCPGAYDVPAWRERIGNLTGEEAAKVMAAMRLPTSAAELLPHQS